MSPSAAGANCVIVLGLDTAGGACSAALWRDGAILAYRTEAMIYGHSAALMPMLTALAQDAGLRLGDAALYGVTTGPGSFTGLRIGLAAVGGMALASGARIVGIDSFAPIAEAVPDAERGTRLLVVAIDSRRAEIFARVFGPDRQPLGEPMSLAPDRLHATLPAGAVLVAGSAARATAEALRRHRNVTLSSVPGHADARVIARLAAQGAHRATADPPSPLYLRSPDAVPAKPARPIVP